MVDKATSPQNDWMFGGSKETNDAELARRRAAADNAQFMPGATTAPNAGAYQWDRGMEAGARQNQDQAQRAYWDMYQGNGPSVAQTQYQRGLGDTMRAQQSMASSARGGAANAAAAQRMAMQQGARVQMQATNDMANIRAQEQVAALGGYTNAANAQRGMDQARSNQAAQWAMGNASLDAQNLDRQQRERMFMEDQQMKQQLAQQDAMQKYWGLDNQNYNTAQGMMQAEDQAKWDRWAGLAGSALGAGGTVLGGFLSKK